MLVYGPTAVMLYIKFKFPMSLFFHSCLDLTQVLVIICLCFGVGLLPLYRD